MDIWPAQPNPLGASYDGSGTTFAVFSEPAEGIDLCLFDRDGHEERVPLPDRIGSVWHGYVPGIGHGQRYGYRVHGPYDPPSGRRCNPAKLLLDPYARAIDGGPSSRNPGKRKTAPAKPFSQRRRTRYELSRLRRNWGTESDSYPFRPGHVGGVRNRRPIRARRLPGP